MNVAIVGATGAVGREMIASLKNFPATKLSLFASASSAGKSINTPFGLCEVVEFDFELVKQNRIVFLAVSGEFSLVWSPQLAAAGCVVIDNSSAFRYLPEIPLVVPEINPPLIKTGGCIIANPNCTTAIAAMVLAPLHRKNRIQKLICSTYQAASGAGDKGMAELEASLAARHCLVPFTPSVFAHNLANNVIPAIDVAMPNGYTKEEMKLCWETRKILGDEKIKISCTAVRVPTVRAHCVAATIEFAEPMLVSDVKEILATAAGVTVADELAAGIYPLPSMASGEENVFVGRIRQNLVFDNGIDLFIAGDQLLRGAALNAVRIAQLII